MEAIRKRTVVKQHGQVTVRGRPYRKGDHVEAIVMRHGRAGGKRGMTARELLGSGLVGMWADREDIADSSEFARGLRAQSHRT